MNDNELIFGSEHIDVNKILDFGISQKDGRYIFMNVLGEYIPSIKYDSNAEAKVQFEILSEEFNLLNIYGKEQITI